MYSICVTPTCLMVDVGSFMYVCKTVYVFVTLSRLKSLVSTDGRSCREGVCEAGWLAGAW